MLPLTIARCESESFSDRKKRSERCTSRALAARSSSRLDIPAAAVAFATAGATVLILTVAVLVSS
jgi:hypothetical protein